MKKTLFVLAMAVLTVCSVVLTGCYHKPVPQQTPSEYYVVGSVYDAQTGQVISNATVTLDGKSVGTTFNVKLDSYVPSVTISASAEGYVAASRTVSIEKLAEYNQVSYINADIALVKEDGDPQLIVVGAPRAGVDGMDAAAVRSLFGIEHGNILVGDKGKVEVCVHYAFVDSDLNVHTNVEDEIFSTNLPYTVKDTVFSGYLWDYTSEEYADVLKGACNFAFSTVNVGTKYADFAANGTEFSQVLNQDGSMTLLGYCVCKDFTLWIVPVSIDGVEMNILALQAMSTHVTPIVEADHGNHDNDNHVNGDNHHNNQSNHTGATAYGGGLGDAE
jgi:hypothetical protein